MRFKIVDKVKYELMEKIVERQDNYIEQIKKANKEIDSLKSLLEIKNKSIHFLSSRVGGMSNSNQKKQTKIEKLQDDLKEAISENMQLKESLKFYQKYGKENPKLEKVKNYYLLRKEVERRSKYE